MSRTITCIPEGTNMYTLKAVRSGWSVLGAAAITYTLFAGNAWAGGRAVTITLHVSAQGLDLSRPDGAQQFYTRLERAAWVVCTHGNRVGLEPAPESCYEKALGDAIRSANVPLVTQVYLARHTLREAAAHGIDVPAQLAAK
jgi:UrcA family protein